MIAVDTNVLVRLIVADDPEQAALVHKLIEDAIQEGVTCFVSDPVLCELEWVLTSRYRARRADVAAAFLGLLANAAFVFEDRIALRKAIESYQQSRADLSDHLIGVKAHAHGATTTWTFDQSLRRCAGFSILG
jgi:predicted nucleic-acid-binding protein